MNLPKFENKIGWGNVASIVVTMGTGIALVALLYGDIRKDMLMLQERDLAHQRRIDKLETLSDTSRDKFETFSNRLSIIETDVRFIRQALERK